MVQRFLTTASLIALVGLTTAGLVHAANAKDTVADRPILSTESTEALIKQREKWGTEPSQASADGKSEKDKKS